MDGDWFGPATDRLGRCEKERLDRVLAAAPHLDLVRHAWDGERAAARREQGPFHQGVLIVDIRAPLHPSHLEVFGQLDLLRPEARESRRVFHPQVQDFGLGIEDDPQGHLLPDVGRSTVDVRDDRHLGRRQGRRLCPLLTAHLSRTTHLSRAAYLSRTAALTRPRRAAAGADPGPTRGVHLDVDRPGPVSLAADQETERRDRQGAGLPRTQHIRERLGGGRPAVDPLESRGGHRATDDVEVHDTGDIRRRNVSKVPRRDLDGEDDLPPLVDARPVHLRAHAGILGERRDDPPQG